EVLGTVSAVVQLLEAAIELIKRLRRAYERQKELAELLESHLEELKSIRSIIQVIKDEEALQTVPSVVATLEKLESTEHKLLGWLKRVHPGDKSSSLRQFSHQLIHGSNDQKDLTNIMGELRRVKDDLRMDIHVEHVAMTRSIEHGVRENRKVIRRIDRRLVLMSGKGQGSELKIDSRVKDLDDCLSTEGSELSRTLSSSSGGSPKHLTRIITRNLAKHQSLMVNEAIGDDLSRHIDHLEITGNTAENNAMMFNHPQSMDVFKQLMEDRRMQRSAPTGS
ncbi:hypothetical protein NA57DRAFT_44289, partial [Rhizodiscina lignyota]